MDTSAALNYANLFMDRFETKALYNYPLKSMIWLRFIDNIFIIFTHGEDQFDQFINYLNKLHPTIKLTHESSHQSVNSSTLQCLLMKQDTSTPPYLKNQPRLTCIYTTPLHIMNKGPIWPMLETQKNLYQGHRLLPELQKNFLNVTPTEDTHL